MGYLNNIFVLFWYLKANRLVAFRGDGQPTLNKNQTQTNFLLIVFDDLRPELSVYGKSHMITPNFERLAAKSVIFDYAFAQVAVCAPSRNSFLTGLRPDTSGLYGFEGTYRKANLLIIPTKLQKSGYHTAGYGKIRHFEEKRREYVWDEGYEGDWYNYQNKERGFMNSSVMPDKNKPEETFPDYIFASKAISKLHQLHNAADGKYFMLALGFKMPHLSMHVPYKYYDMYRSRSHIWDHATPEQLQFPPSAPAVSWRGCASDKYRYMNQEGALKANESFKLLDISRPIPLRAYKEMMWGYAAMITFVDKQLGRVLDAIDELQLWSNLTVVLTADHGMSNGEKGMW